MLSKLKNYTKYQSGGIDDVGMFVPNIGGGTPTSQVQHYKEEEQTNLPLSYDPNNPNQKTIISELNRISNDPELSIQKDIAGSETNILWNQLQDNRNIEIEKRTKKRKDTELIDNQIELAEFILKTNEPGYLERQYTKMGLMGGSIALPSAPGLLADIGTAGIEFYEGDVGEGLTTIGAGLFSMLPFIGESSSVKTSVKMAKMKKGLQFAERYKKTGKYINSSEDYKTVDDAIEGLNYIIRSGKNKYGDLAKNLRKNLIKESKAYKKTIKSSGEEKTFSDWLTTTRTKAGEKIKNAPNTFKKVTSEKIKSGTVKLLKSKYAKTAGGTFTAGMIYEAYGPAVGDYIYEYWGYDLRGILGTETGETKSKHKDKDLKEVEKGERIRGPKPTTDTIKFDDGSEITITNDPANTISHEQLMEAIDALQENIDLELNGKIINLPNLIDTNQWNLKRFGGFTKYAMGGMVQVPGGALEQYGTGYLVHGNRHNTPNPKDGVEGVEFADGQLAERDEVIHNVSHRDGGFKPYVFSEYIKTDGSQNYQEGGSMSIADVAKSILENGGDQNALDVLAKKQEIIAGRDGTEINLKKGGYMNNEYQKGGTLYGNKLITQSDKQMMLDDTRSNVMRVTDNAFDYIPANQISTPMQYEGGGYPDLKYGMGGYKKYQAEGIVEGWEGWEGRVPFEDDYYKDIMVDDLMADNPYSEMIDAHGKTQPTKEDLYKYGFTDFDHFREFVNTQKGWEDYDWDNTTHWGKQHQGAWEFFESQHGKYQTALKKNIPPPIETNGDGDNESKVDTSLYGDNGPTFWDKTKRFAGRYGGDLLAAGLQFIGPYKASQLEGRYMDYSSVPGINLKRVDYNNLLNRNQTGFSAAKRVVEKSVTGPGKAAVLSNLYAAKVDADAKTTTAETQENVRIGNQEAEINSKIMSENLNRMAKVDEYNADMQHNIDKIKVEAIDKASARGAAVIQNALARVSSLALASQVSGESGITSRTDFMKTHGQWDEDKYMEYIKKWYPDYYKQQTS